MINIYDSNLSDQLRATAAAVQRNTDAVTAKGVNDALHNCASRDVTSNNGLVNLLADGFELFAEGILFWLGLYNPTEEKAEKESYQYTDTHQPRH